MIPRVESPYSVSGEQYVGRDKEQCSHYNRREEISPKPVEGYLPVEAEKKRHGKGSKQKCQVQ